eukprot:COSAG02_NODE_43699_length_372_cov_1.029304_1_plen_93_part_01
MLTWVGAMHCRAEIRLRDWERIACPVVRGSFSCLLLLRALPSRSQTHPKWRCADAGMGPARALLAHEESASLLATRMSIATVGKRKLGQVVKR